MALDKENVKKILCCSGSVDVFIAMQTEGVITTNAPLANAYISASKLLVSAIATLIGQPVTFKKSENVKVGCSYACGALSDAIGKKINSEIAFTSTHQTLVDNYAAAAENLVTG
jgi:hypothetical protein